jgi:hypothetical protein
MVAGPQTFLNGLRRDALERLTWKFATALAKLQHAIV